VKRFIKFKKPFIKISFKKGFFIFFSFFVFSCTPQYDRNYTEAYAEIEKGHFRIATDLLEKAAQQDKDDKKRTKAYVEAARIARFEIQDFERAIRLNRQIILKSTDSRQRLLAQDAIAEIYFENIQNYSQALKEMLVLEQLNQGEEQNEKLRFKIAHAQFLSGNIPSALEYIDASLKSPVSDRKNLLKLKAQVLVAQKKFDEALACYEEIFKIDADFFQRENLFISTSIVYEEKEDYSSALAYLQKHQEQIKDKAYLELRIKRLKERLTNKPLFKGRRK
jgi:tetratricopeptide (TPR) repeat protein